MRFKLTQGKLKKLFEKLMVKNIIPSAVISVEKNKLFSVQREEHARALRFLSVKDSYFEEFDCPKEESIEIDVKRALDIVKNILPNSVLTVETKGDKLLISGGNVNAHLIIKEPEDEAIKTLPFEKEDDVPLVDFGEEKTSLDVHFSLAISDFKEIASFGNSLKTEFFGINFVKDNVEIKIGDMLGFNDFISFNPPSRNIKKGEELKVVFTYAIPQIASTFENDVEVKTHSGSPGWFYEETDDYVLGILIPPGDDDE